MLANKETGMEVRKEIGVGVAVGVILLVITWVLDVIKDSQPTGWLGVLASTILTFLGAPRQIPTFVIIIVAAVIARLVFEAGYQRVVAEAKDRLIKQLRAPKTLGAPEISVLESLSLDDTSIEINDLLAYSGLSKVRLEHAVNLLVQRGMVLDHLNNDGERAVTLLPEGTKYVVEQDLDNRDETLKPSTSAPAPAFTELELEILDVIIHAHEAVDFQDLRGHMQHTELRIRHALDKLIERGFLRHDDGNFILTAQGRAIVVERNMDWPNKR